MPDYDYWNATNGEPMTDHDLHEMFDDDLDEMHDDVVLLGMTYTPSNVLKNVDPIAYRVTFSDWLDTMVQNGVLTEEAP